MDKELDNVVDDKAVVHDFNQMSGSLFSKKLFLFLFFTALIGIGSGYLLANNGVKLGPVDMSQINNSSSITKGTVVGSNNSKICKDSAEGVLQKGGVEGEGDHHLVRPGGDSQNVYLSSSVIDLSKFIGKKIKVCGETNKAQKAGWLIDVNRIEVLE